MLSVSSPVAYPPSSPVPKRANPHTKDDGQPKRRVKGGFLMDDSDDSDDADEHSTEPVAKRRMLTYPSRGYDAEAASLSFDTQPNAQIPRLDDPARHSSEHEALGSQLAVLDFLSSAPSRDIFAGQSKFYKATTCDGKSSTLCQRRADTAISYERMVAARSKTKEGRASRAYYGIAIHQLIDAAKQADAETAAAAAAATTEQKKHVDEPVQSIEKGKPRRTLLWTEKYRARNFMDLCGDDGTNRQVLRWLKKWDPVVFPGTARARPVVRRPANQPAAEEKPHRKILMLTGPPGLGKTTLAHVCARQAGYEVLEINASDDRSGQVVQGRIRTSLGTETVKTVANQKGGDGVQAKVARPVCVVVDEVDGVVSGSGAGGEGGFIKALIDLVLLDQKNSTGGGPSQGANGRKRKKQDPFRLSRPLILICNDVYHPSLRPLRHSNLAEIVHVGKPSADAVVGRLAAVFEKEGIPCEKDAARKLCEAAWGLGSGLEAKRGAQSGMEGDLRSVMVVGEWVAGRYRAATNRGPRLTRHWIEQNILQGMAGGGGTRGLGRGGSKDIVNRIFLEGGGFPKQNTVPAAGTSERVYDHEQPQARLGFSDFQKRHTMEQLRQMIETSGETDRIMSDIFAEYPNREFNDDSYLTKPNSAYEWLHFYDTCSAKAFGSQDWELIPYLSQGALACHSLFASSTRHIPAGYDRPWGSAMDVDGAEPEEPLPFSGPRAGYLAHEAEKENRSQLQALHGQLPPTLGRSFRSPEALAVDFMPYLLKIISPDVKPVMVGGSQASTAMVRKESERLMVKRAAEVMADIGITVQRGQIESDSIMSRGPEFVYRLDPDLDVLCQFETAASSLITASAPTRYAVRQVLNQELRRVVAIRESASRQARFRAGAHAGESLEDVMAQQSQQQKTTAKNAGGAAGTPAILVKRDFFGRVIPERPRLPGEVYGNTSGNVVWVTFNEGLNNAVKKPVSFDEFMKGF